MLIYQPSGRAREYAQWASNIYTGCTHGCAYCYVPGVMRVTPEEHGRPKLRETFSIAQLERDAKKRQSEGATGRVLLCFTTDPYQGLNAEHGLTGQAIDVLHRYGFGVEVLTKNPLMAYTFDGRRFQEGDAVAATLTFDIANWRKSREWEPGAPEPEYRYWGLKNFAQLGVQTWASLEPIIDPEATRRVIEQTHRFVTHYKVGRINYIERLPAHLQAQVKGIDWRAATASIIETLDGFGFEEIRDPAQVRPGTYYVKSSLEAYR